MNVVTAVAVGTVKRGNVEFIGVWTEGCMPFLGLLSRFFCPFMINFLTLDLIVILWSQLFNIDL